MQIDSATSAEKTGRELLNELRKVQTDRLDRIDRWYRWDHDKPHAPRKATSEYKELSARAQTPWLWLVVNALAQILVVDGYRPSYELPDGEVGPWRWWLANQMGRRQVAIHCDAMAYGYAYATVARGSDPVTRLDTPTIRGVSPRRMLAFYDDAEVDEVPTVAVQMATRKLTDPTTKRESQGTEVTIWDDSQRHLLHEYEKGGQLSYQGATPHGAAQVPVVRYQNNPDNEGRTPGEVEPFISVAARIDQTTFDRLVVQRFASWVVRTISGMAEPKDTEQAERKKLQLKIEDLLIASDAETKFGSLPATPLDGFLKAKEADVHDLAAVSQTPPHNLLGTMVNLSAEALAAAETSQARKGGVRKLTLGASHQLTIRLAAAVAGDADAAADVAGTVMWQDVEARSLAQVTDALGKMASLLEVPVEWLWGQIPGTSPEDVEEMKRLAQKAGGVDALMRDLLGNASTPSPAAIEA